MTSRELYEKFMPGNTVTEHAQLTEHGLSFNPSTFFTRLIKDAARCNRYSSDVIYDIQTINERLENYDPEAEFVPIWVGFRKDGVDGTSYVLASLDRDMPYSLSSRYFALYSLDVVHEENKYYDDYKIVINEYWM